MNQTAIPPILFRPEQVASRWGVSPWTIRRLMKSGELPSLQVGGRKFVPLDAVVLAEANGGVGGRKPRARGETVSPAKQQESIS